METFNQVKHNDSINQISATKDRRKLVSLVDNAKIYILRSIKNTENQKSYLNEIQTVYESQLKAYLADIENNFKTNAYGF